MQDSGCALYGADVVERVSADSHIGVVSAGYFIPDGIITSTRMAEESGIPLGILTEKFGIDCKHIAPPDEHPAAMGLKAAKAALKNGAIDPREIDTGELLPFKNHLAGGIGYRGPRKIGDIGLVPGKVIEDGAFAAVGLSDESNDHGGKGASGPRVLLIP